MNTESQTDRITQLEIERDEAKVATDFANLRIEQLEASCGVMREALDYCRDYVQHQPYGTLFKLAYVEQALSPTAGQSLLDRLQAVEKERDEYSTALAMICGQPPKYAKPIAEAALKVSEADIAQFIKEYDEGKHPLSKEDEAALERSRPELMQRLKALQLAQKAQP